MEAEEGRYVRTLEDVNSVVNHAKLSRSKLKAVSQVLYFAPDFPEYKLLECDSNLLEYLNSGGELYVRGRPTDKAVVCTDKQTYDLKGAETSNSLLLVPGLKMVDDVPVKIDSELGSIEDKQIVGVYGEYFELKKIKPQLGRLRTLLSARPYAGPENEADTVEGLLTLEDILEEVQASEAEILQNLRDLEAVEIQGFWRLMDHEYHFRALSFLLNLIEERNWPPDSIPMGETMSTLQGLLPPAILDHIADIYLIDTDNDSDEGDRLFALNERKICRFLGETLLRPVDKFNFDDFLSAWQSSVPSGLTTDLIQLDGLALRDTNTNPPVIWYFPEYKLPENLPERFNELFHQRQSWSFDEIAPYLAPFATEKQSTNALLTKYSRSVNVDGRRMYTARHGK